MPHGRFPRREPCNPHVGAPLARASACRNCRRSPGFGSRIGTTLLFLHGSSPVIRPDAEAGTILFQLRTVYLPGLGESFGTCFGVAGARLLAPARLPHDGWRVDVRTLQLVSFEARHWLVASVSAPCGSAGRVPR